jgi:Fusaric acid resistance protein-like
MGKNERKPDAGSRRFSSSLLEDARGWLEHVDSGAHRRIKGLRLVSAYGIAAMLGTLAATSHGLPHGESLGFLAAGFALWASVSEGRTTRFESSRDLVVLVAAAVMGAAMVIGLAPFLTGPGRPGPELTLATGAFLVGYMKRFGVLGTGIGSQVYIGQLLAYGTRLTFADLSMVVVAGLIAALAATIPRLLSGPAEHPMPGLPSLSTAAGDRISDTNALSMGTQAAVAAIVIVTLNDVFGLLESAWAVTACTYVIASSRAGTIERVRRRILGTAIGVPLGLACLPLAIHATLLVWMAAALAMIIYAMALPERYDIACAAYAFTLIVTMAATGEHSFMLLAARGWETLLGGILGLAAAMLIVPSKSCRSAS